MIVDIHMHTYSPGLCYDPAYTEETLGYARRAGVEHGVLLFDVAALRDFRFGEDGPSQEVIHTCNDLTMKQIDHHGDFFTGFCFINAAHDPVFIMDEIERTIARGNLCGIKFEAWVKATDARLDPVLARAAELQIPILHHAFYNNQPVWNESNPAEIADLARRHPDVTIIMAHLGGAGWRGVMDIKHTPNVLVDTAGVPPCAGLIEYAVEQLGAERVIFGSDWPPRDVTVAKARVMGARLSEAQKAAIMGGNGRRVLGL